jgi:phage repressor protein C with HTH and peptisase S24 domain
MTMEDLSADGKQAETDALSSFPTRLKQAMGDSSIRGFARECGFSDTVLRQYLNGQSEPTRPALLAIARTAQVSLEWLAVGEVNSSGRGSSEYVYKEPLAFSADWLKAEFPNSYDHLLLAQVPDESMEPTLQAGDLILVDTQDRDFETINHGIFLLQLDNRILVKRLQYGGDKTFKVLSDHAAYDSFAIQFGKKSQGLSVMGRVVWAAGKL